MSQEGVAVEEERLPEQKEILRGVRVEKVRPEGTSEAL